MRSFSHKASNTVDAFRYPVHSSGHFTTTFFAPILGTKVLQNRLSQPPIPDHAWILVHSLAGSEDLDSQGLEVQHLHPSQLLDHQQPRRILRDQLLPLRRLWIAIDHVPWNRDLHAEHLQQVPSMEWWEEERVLVSARLTHPERVAEEVESSADDEVLVNTAATIFHRVGADLLNDAVGDFDRKAEEGLDFFGRFEFLHRYGLHAGVATLHTRHVEQSCACGEVRRSNDRRDNVDESMEVS
ncbi:hypothetical protein M409DRAFT_54039 [Zasmidium cellare ATCC 36951]|uniref:Uncharacterized protein n=1 Tax=Zasmidium cellare ATCC 36951 TaxID=1080233 RepID=A0A6A6CMQ9_ZASCE|nr:uncharacterized protein M409DRAFT_54039 [Zasmidium cellare ATCC 36951]KAF2167440.1 hypothetical protein M409DRAFT_54039 [Zasmidium cellare ATCC 36951]